jgi:hypothetical protein
MGASCIVTLDYDNDGWQDLYLCRQSDERPLLFKNQQGHGYLDVTAQHQLAGRVSDAAVIDLDLDNDPDLVTASIQAFRYQLNEGGVFSAPVDIGAVPTGGDGWAVAVADIDGDGERDVYGMIGDRSLSSNPNDVIFFRHGLTFTRAPVPRAGGLADDVVIVKPWPNGQVGLLVLNGYDKCCGQNAHRDGPLALFRWGS